MKRLLASLLCLSLFFGSLTLGAISAAPEVQKHYAGVGDYTVSLQADPVTNIIPSD